MQAAPVIIEDNAFIGSRCIVVEGVKVGKEAVLGANVVLTASTKIIDTTGENPMKPKVKYPRYWLFQVLTPKNLKLEIFKFHVH